MSSWPPFHREINVPDGRLSRGSTAALFALLADAPLIEFDRPALRIMRVSSIQMANQVEGDLGRFEQTDAH